VERLTLPGARASRGLQMRRGDRDDDGAAAVADVARRAAVLLQAGVAPRAVWRYLAGADASSAAILADLERGVPEVEAIAARGASWREFAVAWAVAFAVGAALADALRAFAVGLRDAAEAQDDVTVALAEPAATARLMLWLPVVGLLMGAALGFDTFRILFTDPRGMVCLAAGLGLVIVARVWTARLIRRARPGAGLPGIDAELFAIALSGGASIEAAARHVGAFASRVGPAAADTGGEGNVDSPEIDDGPQRSDRDAPLPDDVREVLDLSRAAGVPAVELLRAESASARHRARVEGRLRAAKLGTRLLLPLGVCTLPSFLFLAVAPLTLSILGSTDLPVF
jgi:tight adherence protein B